LQSPPTLTLLSPPLSAVPPPSPSLLPTSSSLSFTPPPAKRIRKAARQQCEFKLLRDSQSEDESLILSLPLCTHPHPLPALFSSSTLSLLSPPSPPLYPEPPSPLELSAPATPSVLAHLLPPCAVNRGYARRICPVSNPRNQVVSAVLIYKTNKFIRAGQQGQDTLEQDSEKRKA
jgi:hypothetical protein